MAITALPQPTILLLGSAQALTTPLSLIKELIDNSLDAKARAIEVHISQNTLDKIEVRDSGHGIQKADFDSLGRRCHTSKLRSFDELKSIGGTSLGFRGEALASAVQLGEVTVTTKTDGESVATCLKLKSVGGIASQTRVAHPVGTTICVKDFCSNIPVRKQTALKSASKTLTQLKELLQKYALTRPTVRFSLKIAKSSKGSWSYSPRPEDGIREAVTQIMGREVAGECLEKSLVFSDPEFIKADLPGTDIISTSPALSSQLKSQQFMIDLFLPKPHADIAKIGRGQFVSVDSRPVAHDKGTMRKIIALFKSYFRASMDDSPESIKNPFLRLNINCPIGSYDPNVEPSKDDVLFENESFLLEMLEKFLQETYGALKSAPTPPADSSFNSSMDNFEILLSRRGIKESTRRLNGNQDSESESIAQRHAYTQVSARKSYPMQSTAADSNGVELGAEVEDMSLQREGRANKWGINMSKELSEEVEQSRVNHENDELHPPHRVYEFNDELPTNSGNDLNPWVIAKMNAPSCSEDNASRIRAQIEHKRSQQSARHLEDVQLRTEHCLPGTGRRRSSGPIDTGVLIDPPIQMRHDNASGNRRPDQQANIRLASNDDNEDLFVGDDASQFARRNNFFSARKVSNSPFPTPPPTQRQNRFSMDRGLMKPFVSPLHHLDRSASQKKFHQTKLGITHPANTRDLEVDANTVQEEGNPDLEWAMEYEHKKDEALRRQRQQFQAAQHQPRAKVARPGADADIVTSSPHNNRFIAAIANLESEKASNGPNGTAKERFKTTLPDNDPRAYLMKQQEAESNQPSKSAVPSKAHRAKPTRLPLESSQAGEQIHNLFLSIPTEIESLRRLASECIKDDIYIQNLIMARGINLTSADTSEIIDRIKFITRKWSETESGGTYEVEYDFGNLVAFANQAQHLKE